tara:strand:+ start:333 stop:572 length:240 start_codon:yes stop_codon:yes gene_type:complete
MDYKSFVKKLYDFDIKLFDYDKRQLYYQLKQPNKNMVGGGERNNIDNFFKCENKKIIIDFYKVKYLDIPFINKDYKSIN